MDFESALELLGITMPGPGYIFGSILFGLLGLAAWRWGKKQERPVTKWIGVALMFYPYVITTTWLMYVVGAALCVGIWLDWRRR